VKERRPSADGVPPLSDSLAEFAGTAILVTVALSAATLIASEKSPVYRWITTPELRRLIAGLITVATAAALVYSPIGKRSGGHFNPAMTCGFLGLRKLRARGAAAYVASQICGAVLGAAIVALVWGKWARLIHFGESAPGHLGVAAAFAAELISTFLLATVVFHFVDRPRIMRLTPIAAAVTTVVFILVEYPASTTSLNPARSLGPAVLASSFRYVWIYLLAPPAGAALAALLFSVIRGPIACGKLVHSDEYACHFQACAYRAAAAGVAAQP
jgi:aquaporin Z